MKETWDRQKNYAFLKRTHEEFKVGDHVYLQVKPFEVLYKIGPIAYSISFPANMRAHNACHVSLLNKYVHDPNHIVNWNVI